MSDGGNIQIYRLAMNMISLRGFKSYEDQTLNNLHPRINVVLGKNGEGKSNFFKAINFVLTDRVTCNRNQFNSYTHRALDNTPQTITVQAYLRNRKSADSQLICITRTWTPEIKEEFRVEGDVFQREEMENYLESLGIAYSNPYHIVQQGRIDHIVRMDDFELYALLEDATGLRKYQRKYDEAMIHMRRIAQQKEEIETVLGEIEGKLKAYQMKKEEYELYNCEELVHKLKSKQDYENQLELNARKLEKAKQNQHGLAEDLVRLRNKGKNLRQQLEQLQQDIVINQRQLSECEVNPEDEDLQNAPIATQQLQDINMRLKRTAQAKQKLAKDWQRKNKQTEAARKDMQAYKARFSAMNAQVQAQKMAKSSKGKVEAKGAIDRLQQNIKETDEQIRKMNAYLKEFKVQNGAREAEEAAALKEKLGALGMQLKAAKMKMFEQNRIKNQLQAQIQALGQQSSAYLHKIKKALPLLDLGLLRQLRKQKVNGVLGYLIEFVEIQPSVAFAYEMAGASKLCTLLVQEESVCAKVIEINRKLKGKQVNMLPVNVLKRLPTEKHNIPSIRDCHGLLNEQWLRVKQHDFGEDFERQIKKLLNNTFGKYVLVESYQLALDISKRYSINCITGEREVVYSEGYFCKVGRDEAQEDRLQLYYKYDEKERLINKAQAKLADSSKQLQALQNVELQLNKKKVALENDSANLARKLDEISYQKRAVSKVQEQIENLQRKKGAFEAELKRSQEILAAIQNKKVQPVNQRQFKQMQQQYNQRQNAYNLRSEEEYAIEQKLTALARQQESLAELAAKMKQQVDFNKSFSSDYINERQYRTRLEQSLQERQARALNLQKEIFAVGQDISERQVAIEAVLAQLGFSNEQVSYYQAQLNQIGTIEAKLEQVQQRSNSLSMSFSRVHGKPRHFYTAKQKLLFSKLTEYRKKYEQKRKDYQQMLEMENQLNEMIDQCQRDKDQQISEIFDKFQRHFSSIFTAITGGKSDVRLKRNKEPGHFGPNRGKFRTAMTILVSFEAERDVSRRWNQLSGGQKSVLAFCVLMALQKCQPAIFYVLDEVDAALDPIYLQRIVDFIRNQSSNSQYFISTFKKEMVEFPEELCNYYLVQMENRVSHISRISQQDAKNAIFAINQ